MKKKDYVKQMRSIDEWIHMKAYNREFDNIFDSNYDIKYSDVLRNIKKYDKNIYRQITQQNSTTQKQQKDIQTLVKPLEKAYKNYLKTQFTVVHYRGNKIPKKILEQITYENSTTICRERMSDFSPEEFQNSKHVFISKSGSPQNPIVGGFALVTKEKNRVYVNFLCSHMGQGKAILDTIRNWIVLTNLDKMITKLELSPLTSAIPFYEKYGLLNNGSNLMSSDTLNCSIPENFNIKNAEDAAKIVKFNYKLYKTIPEKYKEDVKVLTELMGYSEYDFKKVLPLKKFKKLLKDKIENNKKCVENVLKKNGLILEYFSDEIKNNEEMVKIAISNKPWSLEFVSEKLRGNRKIVEYALDKTDNGYLLTYASDALKANEQLVLKAVKTNGFALRIASENLKNNQGVVEMAVNNRASALEEATDAIRQNEDFVLKLIGKQWSTANRFRYISNSLKENKPFILKAIEQNFHVFEYVSNSMKSNKDVVIKALQGNAYMLKYAPDQFTYDKEVVLKAVRNRGDALHYVSSSLKNDKDVVRTAILNGKNKNYVSLSPFKYASDTLKADKQFVKSLLDEKTLSESEKEGVVYYANTKVKQQIQQQKKQKQKQQKQ
jgi:hypothetical protein